MRWRLLFAGLFSLTIIAGQFCMIPMTHAEHAHDQDHCDCPCDSDCLMIADTHPAVVGSGVVEAAMSVEPTQMEFSPSVVVRTAFHSDSPPHFVISDGIVLLE